MQLRHVLLLLTLGFLALALWRERENNRHPSPSPKSLTENFKTDSSTRAPSRLVIKGTSAAVPGAVLSFKELLHADRFCEVSEIARELNADLRAQFFASLEFPAGSVQSELASPEGPYYGKLGGNQAFASAAARLIYALRIAGDFGNPAAKSLRDPLIAWTLLTQLHNEEPKNAAYLFFRLGIEQEQDYPLSQRLATVDALFQSIEFKSHTEVLYRETFQAMRQNSSKFLVGISVINQLEMPVYSRALMAVQDMDFLRPGLAARIGGLMTEPGSNSRDSYKIGGYNVIEYSIGRNLVKSASLAAFPDMDRTKSGPRGGFSDFYDMDGPASPCTEATRQKFLTTLADWL